MKKFIILLLLGLIFAAPVWAAPKGLKVNGERVDVGGMFRVTIEETGADVTLESVEDTSFSISYPGIFVTSADKVCSNSTVHKRATLSSGDMLIQNACDRSILPMVVFDEFQMDDDGYLSVRMHQPKL